MKRREFLGLIAATPLAISTASRGHHRDRMPEEHQQIRLGAARSSARQG